LNKEFEDGEEDMDNSSLVAVPKSKRRGRLPKKDTDKSKSNDAMDE